MEAALLKPLWPRLDTDLFREKINSGRGLPKFSELLEPIGMVISGLM